MEKYYTTRAFAGLLAMGMMTCTAAPSIAGGIVQKSFYEGQVVIKGSPQEIPTGYSVVRYYPHADLTVVEVGKGQEEKHIKSFQNKGRKAGLNLRYKSLEEPVTDTFYHYQWNFPMVQSAEAWTVSAGEAVSVAVLDTGLKTDGAEDGIACVAFIEGSDIVNGDNDPVDGDGHGTHVSGTIAQSTDNGIGVAGLSHNSCIMPVKVLDDNGGGSTATIADGIYFAVNHGAKVINMSLGLKAKYNITSDPLMDPALEYAHNKGVTVVCASGNDSWRKNVSYPAIHPATIAVGAVGEDSVVASYSNGGTGLDIVAPGGGDSDKGIMQETYLQTAGGWGYYNFKGTSMATPHVAAVAAMLYADSPFITPEMVREAINSSARDLGATGYDSSYGNGLVQAYAALQYFSDCTIDADGDGISPCDGDCDDGDPLVFPGADESCEDEIDNNCNEKINEGCTSICLEDEICDDGLDNDCDGLVDEDCGPVCQDQDGDGWTDCAGDCNDNNPLVYPGHLDRSRGRWADGLDNDCNGTIDG